ncbi:MULTISPECIES: ferredoxin reductase [unclassified Microbacterium]|uniref:ferredoxin reductase n=1 Tax=unclassified Microbacterium TaxID=2609290 RepID=UPI003443F926
MIVAGWRPARVIGVTEQTASARSILLDVTDWPGNDPGQHVDVRLTAEDGYQAVRSYSLASSGDATVIELGVDEIPTGEVSPYLVRDMVVGDELEVKGPLGQYFVWRTDQEGPVQLIAGGSGIVPLVAMVRAATAAGVGSEMRLLYSVRTAQDAMFGAELLGETSGVDVRWAYTRAAPAGWHGRAGRLDADAVAEAVWPAVRRPLVFVCGPTGFVEHVSSILVRLGHDPERVRTERFGGS